jgi:hypothetical protein
MDNAGSIFVALLLGFPLYLIANGRFIAYVKLAGSTAAGVGN